ncbi:MAG: cell division protein FtsA [Candidatus Paceibacterota bacterium]|jgi:cell division protein FtsA
MRTKIAAGIDIGTHEVKIILTETRPEGERATPKIVGAASAESKGIRHGYIVNPGEAAESVIQAVAAVEKASGIKVKKAVISISGISLSSMVGTGSVSISRGDSEVTEMDIDKASAVAEKNIPASALLNRRIVHTVPLSYKIDGKPVFGRPRGMKGNKLEVRALFVTCLSQHLDDLVETITEAGIEVIDIVASPVAAALVALSKNQKVAGCVLANIGAETLSIVVYENNLPISLEVFPLGSTDITNDIALGLKIPIEEAESLKRGGTPAHVQFSKKKLDEIVSARLYDMFDLIEAHLKKIDKNGLLPAGIILIGGGAGIPLIDELAKDSLRIPARIISHKEAPYSVAYGLSMLALNGDETGATGTAPKNSPIVENSLKWLKQFLP